MSTDYHKHVIGTHRLDRTDQLHVVPILNWRLNFAVIVHQVVDGLKLNRHDLIAVALPPRTREKIEPVVRSWTIEQAISADGPPQVQVLTAAVRDSDERLAFPITPCDGMIEGVRLALERGIPFAFVDQELAPGNLVSRTCLGDPSWPDDSWALRNGARWYLDRIQHVISHWPARTEPLDTWRETAMVVNLRRLLPWYHRVVFICAATDATPVLDMLTLGEVAAFPEESVSDVQLVVQRLDLKPEIVLRYLDDIPRLVELYERDRRAGRAADFNKREALLTAIREVDRAAGDMDVAIRSFQTFAAFLSRLMDRRHRISPTLEQSVRVCEACMGRVFSKRAKGHLVGYGDQIDVARVETLADHEDVIVLKPFDPSANGNGRAPQATYDLAGPCSANYSDPQIRERPTGSKEDSSDDWYLWPPWKWLHSSLTVRAYQVAGARTSETRISEFRGFLGDGIELRRTMQSMLQDRPTLYVKTRRRRRQRNTDDKAPVVWILRSDSGGRVGFTFNWSGVSKKQVVVGHIAYIGARKNKRLRNIRFKEREIAGCTYFSGVHHQITEIQRHFGSEMETRIPKCSSYEYDPEYAHVTPVQRERLERGAPWWEILLLEAIDFAKDDVVFVAPNGFRLPGSVSEYARNRKVRLHPIPLATYFAEEEIRKLGKRWTIAFPAGERTLTDEYFDYEFQDLLVKECQPYMEEWWG